MDRLYPALDRLATIPAGCVSALMTDRRHAPHLLPGDVVVVDLAQKSPIHGELFLVRSGRLSGVWQCSIDWRHGRQCVSFLPLNRPLTPADAGPWIRAGRELFVADIGLPMEWALERMIGRVIGVYGRNGGGDLPAGLLVPTGDALRQPATALASAVAP